MKAKSLLPQPKPGQRYITRIAPQHLSVFLNLGNLMAKDPDRYEEADNLYKQAISMRNDYVQVSFSSCGKRKANEPYDVYEQILVSFFQNLKRKFNDFSVVLTIFIVFSGIYQ